MADARVTLSGAHEAASLYSVLGGAALPACALFQEVRRVTAHEHYARAHVYMLSGSQSLRGGT